MARDATRPEPLDAQASARLADFARGCKAAARVVSLYPDTHPSVQSALSRLVEAARRATATGPLRLTVLPGDLLVDGRSADKPDAAVPELAVLLHRHGVGSLTVGDAADTATWQALLRLLSRAPEEVRAAGGIAHLWTGTDLTTVPRRVSIELHEIDYEQILRGGGDDTASLDAIIASCLAGGALDDQTKAALRQVAGDPRLLEQLVQRAQSQSADGGPAAQAHAVLGLLSGAVDAISPPDPEAVKQTLRSFAVVIGGLTPDAMASLLSQRGSPEAVAGGVDVVAGVAGQMSEGEIAEFVAGSIVSGGGATGRLAEAFQALVPDLDSRRQLLSLVEQKVSESPLGQAEDYQDVWKRTEDMLTSYSDEKYVHDDYARELTRARTQALEVEQGSGDPPERVAAWIATVDDRELRQLDLQLLLDLLRIESDAHRWHDIADTVVQHIEELTRAGDIPGAVQLVDAVAQARGEDEQIPVGEESHRAYALGALERVATGRAMRHALGQLRSNDEQIFDGVKRLCTVLGPTVVTSLAEMLASEQDARARRRIRDILLGFGKRGRDAVQQLLNAPNWEVRQTAAFLLREFGGTEGLPELERLLSDSEPLVQREAMRALILIGDERTYDALTRVLAADKSRSRETLIQQLTGQRDERAIPLCTYLIRHIDHRTLSDVFLAAVETLGNIGGQETVPPLKEALYKGEWWAPFRTKALRVAAAQALGRIKIPAALDVLRDAAARGSWGVKSVARAQLGRLGDVS